MRAAAAVIKGRKKAPGVKWAIVVPGSGLVKAQAEAEGLDRIFTDAGLEWREPGCSACLAMNPDKVPAGERCARSEEHTSELQSLMRNSYAVFCLKKKKNKKN